MQCKLFIIETVPVALRLMVKEYHLNYRVSFPQKILIYIQIDLLEI